MGGGVVVIVRVLVWYTFLFLKSITFLTLNTCRRGVSLLSDERFIALVTVFINILPLIVTWSPTLHLVGSSLFGIGGSVCVIND